MDDTCNEEGEFSSQLDRISKKKRLTRNKTKDGQADVDQEICGATPLQKDAKGRKDDSFDKKKE